MSKQDEIGESIEYIVKGYALNRVANGHIETDDKEYEVARWSDWAREEIEAYAQRKADEARIEELLAVQKSADAFDRMDHCGCDDYIPRRLATLNSQTPTPKNEMKRRGVA